MGNTLALPADGSPRLTASACHAQDEVPLVVHSATPQKRIAVLVFSSVTDGVPFSECKR
jgi:hypothetical protein